METQPLAAGSRLAFNPLRSFHFRQEQEYVFADRFAPPSRALRLLISSTNFRDSLPFSIRFNSPTMKDVHTCVYFSLVFIYNLKKQ